MDLSKQIQDQSLSALPSLNATKRQEQQDLRFYLGTEHYPPMYEHGNITTKSSIGLTALQSQLNKLEKIADKNSKGKLGIPESEFLDLIMCPYLGQGKKDTVKYNNYLKEKARQTLDTKHPNLQVTLDRFKFMDNSEVKKQIDPDLTKRLKMKKDKESLEKKNAEEQKELLSRNSN